MSIGVNVESTLTNNEMYFDEISVACRLYKYVQIHEIASEQRLSLFISSSSQLEGQRVDEKKPEKDEKRK